MLGVGDDGTRVGELSSSGRSVPRSVRSGGGNLLQLARFHVHLWAPVCQLRQSHGVRSALGRRIGHKYGNCGLIMMPRAQRTPMCLLDSHSYFPYVGRKLLETHLTHAGASGRIMYYETSSSTARHPLALARVPGRPAKWPYRSKTGYTMASELHVKHIFQVPDAPAKCHSV